MDEWMNNCRGLAQQSGETCFANRKGQNQWKVLGYYYKCALHSSVALMLPTAFFKANMDENFFFFYLGFLQREEFQQPNLREFPGVEFSDGSSSPSNLTQEPLTT